MENISSSRVLNEVPVPEVLNQVVVAGVGQTRTAGSGQRQHMRGISLDHAAKLLLVSLDI